MKLLLATIVIAQFLSLGVVAQDEAAGDGADGNGADAGADADIPGSPDEIALPAPAYSCACATTINPVCGTNGQTYTNECVLACASGENVKHGRSSIGIHHKGWCKPWYCRCPKYYKPVCGSDGKTYRNICYLKCENKRRAFYGLKPIYVKNYGPCKPFINWCWCPNIIAPVCGTDGKTYRNWCYLQCASQLNVLYGFPPIYVKKWGPCKFEKCDCPYYYQPVCASNGITYYNWCYFNCANRRRFALGLPLLYIKKWGPC